MKSKGIHLVTNVTKGIFTKSVHLGLNLAFGQPDRPEAGTRPYGNGILARPCSPAPGPIDWEKEFPKFIRQVEDLDSYGIRNPTAPYTVYAEEA